MSTDVYSNAAETCWVNCCSWSRSSSTLACARSRCLFNSTICCLIASRLASRLLLMEGSSIIASRTAGDISPTAEAGRGSLLGRYLPVITEWSDWQFVTNWRELVLKSDICRLCECSASDQRIQQTHILRDIFQTQFPGFMFLQVVQRH